jgi:hypothetical protein
MKRIQLAAIMFIKFISEVKLYPILERLPHLIKIYLFFDLFNSSFLLSCPEILFDFIEFRISRIHEFVIK